MRSPHRRQEAGAIPLQRGFSSWLRFFRNTNCTKIRQKYSDCFHLCSDSGDIAVRKFPGFVDMFAHTDFPGRQAGSGGDKKRRKEGEVSEEEEERGKRKEERGKRKEERSHAEVSGKIVRRDSGRSCRSVWKSRAEASGRSCRSVWKSRAEAFGKALRRAVCAQRRPQHEASERRPEPQSGRFFRKFILPFRILGLSLCALETIRALFGV